ncbi:hypothetical protein B0H13DRAFT_2437139 [Mycena leptocephala]|nr:hypothetical protein B0H13DRAFT_2437139 [Mycena leptocephala]
MATAAQRRNVDNLVWGHALAVVNTQESPEPSHWCTLLFALPIPAVALDPDAQPRRGQHLSTLIQPDHYMVQDNCTPAMLLLLGGKELVLVTEVHTTELWPWLANNAYGVGWSVAVAKEKLEYPGNWVWMEITLNVYVPADLAALYLPQMQWGLSPAGRARTMHDMHPPQELPPLWVLQAWRDHGLLIKQLRGHCMGAALGLQMTLMLHQARLSQLPHFCLTSVPSPRPCSG